MVYTEVMDGVRVARSVRIHGRDVRSQLLRDLDTTGLRVPLRKLRGRLGLTTPMYLVGGAVRDCVRTLREGGEHRPKDADVVVATRNLGSALRDIPGTLSTTPLGGFRWMPDGATAWIDVWQLVDTVWIEALGLSATMDSFLAGVDLNVDRIAVAFHERAVLDGGCLAAVRSCVIDLDARVHLPELRPAELARAVIAHFKTGYALSATVQSALNGADATVLSSEVIERLRQDGYDERDLTQVRRFVVGRGRRPTVPQPESAAQVV